MCSPDVFTDAPVLVAKRPGRLPQASDYGTRSGGGDHQGQARLRRVGTDILWGIDGRRGKRVLVKVVGERACEWYKYT